MENFRILHVVSSLSLNNGITNVVMNYYRNIDRDKIQFDFLYFEESSQSHVEEINSLGGKTYKIEAPNLKNIGGYNLYLRKFFFEINFNYEVVHSHELVLLTLITKQLRKFNVKHIIAHSHSVAYSYHPIKSIRNYILSRPVKSIADSLFACSSASAEFWYGKKIYEKGQVQILYNAIDCEVFSYNISERKTIRRELGLEGKFVIGHVGRFPKEKNHKFIIDIFNEVQSLQPNSLLILVGTGPLYNEIQEKASFLNLQDKILFVGQTNNIHTVYQAMDAFLFPSVSEGLGMAAIEAQSAGLPCIISDTLPKEAHLNDPVALSLNKPPLYWAQKVIETKSKRKEIKKIIEKKGYCITKEAKVLEERYIDIKNKLNYNEKNSINT